MTFIRRTSAQVVPVCVRVLTAPPTLYLKSRCGPNILPLSGRRCSRCSENLAHVVQPVVLRLGGCSVRVELCAWHPGPMCRGVLVLCRVLVFFLSWLWSCPCSQVVIFLLVALRLLYCCWHLQRYDWVLCGRICVVVGW